MTKKIRHRIYVAGPYQPIGKCTIHNSPRITLHNVDKAIVVSNQLIEKGHYVFCPHLSYYIHVHISCHKDYKYWWYDEDMTFIDHWATAIYLLPTWKKSKGAKIELKRAKLLGLKVFTRLEDVEQL